MSNIEVRIEDSSEGIGKSEEKLKKDIKKIDRFIKKTEAKIRSYEKQIEQINSVSEDTRKQVEIGLSLLEKRAEGDS